MDEVICSFHSELIAEEQTQLAQEAQRTEEEAGGVFHQVDMFSGELSENVSLLNFIRQQVKNVIPPKQTARCQVTDIRFAKLGKDELMKLKAKQRKAMRTKAKDNAN